MTDGVELLHGSPTQGDPRKDGLMDDDGSILWAKPPIIEIPESCTGGPLSRLQHHRAAGGPGLAVAT